MQWPPDPNTVQHVSLPLELLGLFLAFLEMFYEEHANKLEASIDRIGHWTNPFTKNLTQAQRTLRGSRVMDMALLICLGIMLAFGLGTFGNELVHSIVKDFGEMVVGSFMLFLLWIFLGPKNERWWWVPLIIGLPLIAAMAIVAVPFYLISKVIDFFNWIGDERATGGIGLALGCLGLVGEVYQVIMIDKDSDPKTVLEIWSVYAAVVIALGVVAFFVHRIVKGEVKQ